MQLQVLNSPFTDEQVDLLNKILPTLSNTQQIWLSGYLTGYQSQSADVPTVAQQQITSEKKVIELTVLYGSQTGNCQNLAEGFAGKLKDGGFKVNIASMNEFKPNQLKKLSHLLIVVSTQGEGDPPDNAIGFHEFLYSKRAPKLTDLNYSVLSLGDSSYDLFCYTGKQFDERLAELGANRIIPRVDCDLDYDEPAEQWYESVFHALQEESGTDATTAAVQSSELAQGEKVFSRTNPFYAEVYENINLNGRGSNKETRHLELSLEGSNLTFEPGDSIGIYPQNERHLAEKVIELLQLKEDEQVEVNKNVGHVSFVDALTHHVEITVLSKSLLEKLLPYTKDQAFSELVQSEDAEKLKEYIHGRDLVDLLSDFSSWTLTATDLITVLRKLPARLYSIASSYEANPDEVHLTIGKVNYEAHGRERNGVCSVQIAERVEPGDTLPIYVHKNPNFRLPEDDEAPIIMIGPGTGVAPFRAFVEHLDTIGSERKTWLFFGDQHYVTDFLYQTDWQGWLKNGSLTKLNVAFSRDQEEKDYVQHHLEKHAKDVYEWLEEGAHIYICGDEKHMAQDVHQTLLQIIQTEGQLSEDDAKTYVTHLQNQKRYQRDVY